MIATKFELFPWFHRRLSFIAKAIRARGQIAQVLQFMLFFSLARSVVAEDWPQILGPSRDGQAVNHPSISEKWPESAQINWQVGIGSGYGGAAIVEGKVLVLHRFGIEEVLEAVELSSGKKVWRATWPATYEPSVNPDNGPRCVPTVVNKRAICYGAAGDLACVDTSNGKLLWLRALRKEYQAEDGYFGAGSSPLVVGETAVVCLGGQQAGIVAVNINTGKTLWTATNYDASYASPIAIDPNTILVVTRLKTVLLNLNDGAVLSEFSFGSRGPTVNAATPILLQADRVLLTASYGVGASLLSTAGRTLTPVFQGSQLLSSQYNTPVAAGSRVVGIDGREDVGVASLVALDAETQKQIWNQPAYGTAHLIAVGPQALALKLDGSLELIDLQANSYRKIAQTRLPLGTYRATPALSSGRIVVRSTDADAGRSQLICIALPLK